LGGDPVEIPARLTQALRVRDFVLTVFQVACVRAYDLRT